MTLCMTPKLKQQKIKWVNCTSSKLKISYLKDLIKIVKRQPMKWEEIHAVIYEISSLYLEYRKNSYNSVIKTTS